MMTKGRGAMASPQWAIVDAINRSIVDESTSQRLGAVDQWRRLERFV